MENADAPAMPFEGGQNNGIEPPIGMTKLEYFSAIAMQGLLANKLARSQALTLDNTEELIGEASVVYAKALLSALKAAQEG